MSNDKVLGNIRKLLNTANDQRGNEQERETALRMAHKLLAKHNLTMAEAEAAGDAPNEPREHQVARLSVYPWARQIAYNIAKLFFCGYYFERPSSGKLAHHYFIGRQSNAITANEMSAYVVTNVFKELRARFGSETSPEARSFATGVADTLRVRIYELMKNADTDKDISTSGALVVANLYRLESDANDQWLADKGVKLRKAVDRTKGTVAGAAYAAGKEHGNKIQLNTQITTGTNSKLARLK